MVSSIKNNRSTPTTTPSTPPSSTTPSTTTPSTPDVDAEDLAPASTDVAARRAAIDTVTAGITDEMRGLIVTPAEATAAVAQLKSLPPKDALLALQDLRVQGSLDTLASNVDDSARRDLVTLMISSGFVGSESGRVSGASPGGPVPPTAPTFARQESGLSPTVKTMVRDENLARLDGFGDAFDAYRGDYQQAVRGAKSFEALRTLGPIAEPTMPIHEPGTKSDADHAWAKGASTSPDTQTARILTDTVFRLGGKSPPGTDFVLEGTVKMGLLEVNEKYSEDRSGKVERETTTTASAFVAETGRKTTTTDGKAKTSKEPIAVGVDVKGNKLMVGPGGLDGELDAGGAKGKLKLTADEVVAGGGARELGLEASFKKSVDERGHERTTLKATVEVDGLTATVGLDSDGGMIAGVGVDTDDFEGQLEITTQLASTADYARAFATIEGDVFSNPPPELARGVKWSGLNADEQAAYAFLGWDKQQWEGTQKQSSSLVSARVAGR